MNSLSVDAFRSGREAEEPHQVHDVLGRQRVDLPLGQLGGDSPNTSAVIAVRRPGGDGVGADPVALQHPCGGQCQRGVIPGFGRAVNWACPGGPTRPALRGRC